MPMILTFGDSNTHGSGPMQQAGVSFRYGPRERWPTVMARALGPDWHLVEEGLPGRTTMYHDPVMGGCMNGRIGLDIALRSHCPIDVLTIMLGTNDVKTRFNADPEAIVSGLSSLIDLCQVPDTRETHPALKLLLICPPRVREIGPFAGEFWGAESKMAALPEAIARLATARDVAYFDSNHCISVCDEDGIHFDSAAHRTLGAALARVVGTL